MSNDPRSQRRQTEADRLVGLIDLATDKSWWTDDLETAGRDAITYDEDPVRQWERRLREAEVSALGAIALLLLRRDEEMWDEWERYVRGY